jgi:PAS domain S-box-containing protein
MPQSVLIVAFDPQLRKSLVRGLDRAGCAVHEAETASQALRLVDNLDPELVLLDVDIPGSQGMPLLRSLKARRPATPFVVVSGQTDIGCAIEAFRSGASDFVAKSSLDESTLDASLGDTLTRLGPQRPLPGAQKHLLRLIHKLPVVIFIINRNLEFEFLNQATKEILGYPPQEILRSPRAFLRRIAREDRGRFLHALKRSLRPEATELHLEFRFLHKKGYTVFLAAQSIAPPLCPGAAPDRIEGMILDMTRTSYMDKLLLQNEKLSMLRSMTEEVAHEIRNPLVSLGGFARQLRNRHPEAIETRIILEECCRLERLLQRINAYLEPISVTLTRCLVPPTVNFIMSLISRRLDHKSITCDIDLGDGLSPVLADQEFLHRIFIYLLGHGADIVERAGFIRVTGQEAGGQVQVCLAMEPVGGKLGHDRMIMPFEDDEMNLAMCLRLVERIGGHLRMAQQGRLAQLTLSIPAYDGARETGTNEAGDNPLG